MTKKTPEFLNYHDDGTCTVTLATTVSVNGIDVPSINMREPAVRDQLAADKIKGGDAERELSMFANLCEISPGDIEALSLRNYKRLQAAYLGFTD